MKRFLLLATAVAFLAAGCQKTEVENEVLTPIGFSTKVGKQVKAIAQNTQFDENQPFGVFAYSYQTGTKKTNIVIPNDEIKKKSGNDWKATIVYYWPNDPRTSLDFYAYSPFVATTSPQSPSVVSAAYNHQKILSGTLSHTRTYDANGAIQSNTLQLKDYIHSNMYVDFMVADSVRNATYANTSTVSGDNLKQGNVGLNFRHQMTQLIFNVKTNDAYKDIKFTVESIVLNDIHNKATYTKNYKDAAVWALASETDITNYVIFPVKALKTATYSDGDDNGSPEITANQTATVINETVSGTTNNITLTTAAVTMIPQTLEDHHTFTVTYTIEGTGVAKETVIKTLKFKDVQVTRPNNTSDEQWAEIQKIKSVWAANKKIIYNLTIGLNEITFTPSVTAWDPTQGSYDITPSAN